MNNRARLRVTLGGPWRLYQRADMPGWEMLGTVQRGGEIGALARNKHTGIMVVMHDGCGSVLDQRKAAAALATATTPAADPTATTPPNRPR